MNQSINLILRVLAASLVGALWIQTPAYAEFGKQIAKLSPSDGVSRDWFGYSADIDNDIVIIGAPGDHFPLDDYTLQGSAYLFDAASGNELAKLTASDGVIGDLFGTAVSVSGNLAIVGAPGAQSDGVRTGAVYLFDVTSGQQIAKFVDGDNENDDFGFAAAISGNLAIVGAYRDKGNSGPGVGSAYLFDVTTGQQIANVFATDTSGNYFGTDVSIDGKTAIVGRYGDGHAGNFSGAAYVFDAHTGEQLNKLVASDAAFADQFGDSVAVRGSIALVGAPNVDGQGANSGAAYLFDLATGQERAKWTISEAGISDKFGAAIDMTDTMAIIASLGRVGDIQGLGHAFIYDITTGDQLANLAISGSVATDRVGWSVAISEDWAVVGAPAADANDPASLPGSAYLFSVSKQVPEPGTGMCTWLTFGLLLSYRRRLPF